MILHRKGCRVGGPEAKRSQSSEQKNHQADGEESRSQTAGVCRRVFLRGKGERRGIGFDADAEDREVVLKGVAGGENLREQRFAGALRAAVDGIAHLLRGERFEDAVGAEEELVAGTQGERPEIAVDGMKVLLAEIAGEGLAGRMMQGFVAGEFSGGGAAVEAAGVGVRLIELRELTAAGEVESAVSDGDPVERIVPQHGGCERGAHVVGRMRVDARLQDGMIGFEAGALQSVGYGFDGILLPVTAQEGMDSGAAGFAAVGESAHAIGNDPEEAGVAEKLLVVESREAEGILLVLAGANVLRIAWDVAHESRLVTRCVAGW